MFDRLKKAFSATPPLLASNEGLSSWATNQMLSHHRLASGVTAVEGSLHDKPFKAGCASFHAVVYRWRRAHGQGGAGSA